MVVYRRDGSEMYDRLTVQKEIFDYDYNPEARKVVKHMLQGKVPTGLKKCETRIV